MSLKNRLIGVIDRWFAKHCEITWEKEHNGLTVGRNGVGDSFWVRYRGSDFFGDQRGWYCNIHQPCPEGKYLCDCRDQKIVGIATREEIMALARQRSFQIHDYQRFLDT